MTPSAQHYFSDIAPAPQPFRSLIHRGDELIPGVFYTLQIAVVPEDEDPEQFVLGRLYQATSYENKQGRAVVDAATGFVFFTNHEDIWSE
jgi:hypothetical protein